MDFSRFSSLTKRLQKPKPAVIKKAEAQTRPEQAWGIGLLLFLGLVMIGGLASFFLFHRYLNLDLSEVDVPELQLPRYQAELVDKALDLYQARQAHYEFLLTDRSNNLLIDPEETNEPEGGGILEADESAEDDEEAPPIDLSGDRPELGF